MGFGLEWPPGVARRSSGLADASTADVFRSDAVPVQPVERIRRQKVFAALAHPAGRATAGPIRVRWVPGDRPVPQVGYAVSRRCGSAVARNRIRRRLRAAVRLAAPPPGWYLVSADRRALDLHFCQLQGAVSAAMRQAVGKGTGNA
jgi:ribonuclease P protein component